MSLWLWKYFMGKNCSGLSQYCQIIFFFKSILIFYFLNWRIPSRSEPYCLDFHRSIDPLYLVNFCVKRDKESWTCCMSYILQIADNISQFFLITLASHGKQQEQQHCVGEHRAAKPEPLLPSQSSRQFNHSPIQVRHVQNSLSTFHSKQCIQRDTP